MYRHPEKRTQFHLPVSCLVALNSSIKGGRSNPKAYGPLVAIRIDNTDAAQTRHDQKLSGRRSMMLLTIAMSDTFSQYWTNKECVIPIISDLCLRQLNLEVSSFVMIPNKRKPFSRFKTDSVLYLSVSVLKRSDSKWEKVGPTSGAF